MRYTSFILILFSFIACSCTQEVNLNHYKAVREGFENPTGSARPKVYWWCLNGNIDTLRAKQELLAMKEAGIGGFDFFEIGVPKRDTMIPGGPAFLSEESLDLIEFVVREAGKLDLTMGLALASSWNAGGSWIKPEHGAKSLYFSEIALTGNSKTQQIDVPFPEVSFPKKHLIGGTGDNMIPFREDGRPGYYEEIAILAIPDKRGLALDTSMILDVSHFFDPETNILHWEVPPGSWKIMRYICSNSGQQLVLPSPESAGLTIDHFDSVAVEKHLMHFINLLKPRLGDFQNTPLKSFYLASYEARGFVWTSSFSDEFKELHGYDIKKFIPSLFDPEIFDEATAKKIQTDFKKTLSELMINNLYKKSREICNRYGLKINCEAGGPGFPLYNGPAEPLKALGALDIPRGEFWVNHARYYEDGNDSIDILNVVKEVAAASHIYQKSIVEEEAFTSFQHWQEGPFDIKPQGDRAFCEGMNRVVFHGFSHNISGSGFPGFVYSAGTHFNDKRVWWSKVKPFIDYWSRLSSVFQESDFYADVLYYYGDKVPNSATPKNNRFTAGPGYDYEVINTEILLNEVEFEKGKLVLSNGAGFSLLALATEDLMNPEVLIKLKELAGEGALIIGEKPLDITGIKNPPIAAGDAKDLIRELWQEDTDPENLKNSNRSKIYSGVEPLDALRALGVSPDLDYRDRDSFLLDYIHYKKGDVDFYFLRNTKPEWISYECGFRQQDKVPEIWDPLSGEIIPVTVYKQEGEYLRIPLSLAPAGSQLIVFRAANQKEDKSQFTYDNERPPLLTFTQDGFYLHEEPVKRQPLDGEWEVFFQEGPGAPESAVFPVLASWTESENDGIRYYSGTASYHKTFSFEPAPDETSKVFLDLGELSKVGEVWLNQQPLGISWALPHRFDVSHIIKAGENHLVVEVANTWSNRIVGDVLTEGKNYTNTNITRTILPNESIRISDQSRVPWAKVPLIKSGLLGPVEIEVTRLIN